LSTGIQAHHNAIFDLAWMEEELKLVIVSGDHTAVLWDVSIMPFRQLRQFRGHTRSVKTVAFRPQDKSENILLIAAENFLTVGFVHISDHHPYSFRPSYLLNYTEYKYSIF
jgi:WD40 repeat protein